MVWQGSMAKHETLSKELRVEIAAGNYGTWGQLSSEAKLFERFGVSRPTVARALLDLQNEGLMERRAGAGTFVSQKTSGNTEVGLLGLLVPERVLPRF